jgi:CubicO group peptidase (beta-lactamase class C family)
LTSALVGIAVDRGMIESTDDSPFDYLPEYAGLTTETNSDITIEHLLSFSSGFDWNEHDYGFDDSRDSHYQMFAASDPMEYLLSRPVVFDPGGEFQYNSGDTNILGEIVRRASSSRSFVEFAHRYLFGPLGIDEYDWVTFPLSEQTAFASAGASLRPRDMAKFGLLYLNGGEWNGERVVSSGWVDSSTELTTPLVGNYRTLYGYGYNWWLGRSPYRGGRIDYFRASGWGGQNIYVYPDLDLVIVLTSGAYYETRAININDIIEKYVLRAISD